MSRKHPDDYKIKTRQLVISPFNYNTPSISSISIRFLVLLSLQLVMLLFTRSFSAFLVVIAALLGSLAAAGLNCIVHRKEYYQIMNMAIQGIMIGLLLPEGYPPVPVFFISFLVLLFSRSVVFKSVNSWLNMTAFAVIIAWIIGRNYFPPFLLSPDVISLRNSSLYLIQNGIYPVYSLDSTITTFLNSYVFSVFKVSIPEGFISLLWDSGSTIPAFRFNLLTILSSVFVFADEMHSEIIPAIFIALYALLVRLFAPMFFGGFFNQGDIILALCSSGVLFCTVFLLQWFGTVPVTMAGKVISAVTLAVTAFLIIGSGTSPIGMMYTILINNVVTLFIRAVEEQNNLAGISKVVAKHALKNGAAK